MTPALVASTMDVLRRESCAITSHSESIGEGGGLRCAELSPVFLGHSTSTARARKQQKRGASISVPLLDLRFAAAARRSIHRCQASIAAKHPSVSMPLCATERLQCTALRAPIAAPVVSWPKRKEKVFAPLVRDRSVLNPLTPVGGVDAVLSSRVSTNGSP
jgi:hypothetical protein